MKVVIQKDLYVIKKIFSRIKILMLKYDKNIYFRIKQ